PGEEADDEEQAAHDRDRGGMAGARWCGGGRGHRKTSPVWMPFPRSPRPCPGPAGGNNVVTFLPRMLPACQPRRAPAGAVPVLPRNMRAPRRNPLFLAEYERMPGDSRGSGAGPAALPRALPDDC